MQPKFTVNQWHRRFLHQTQWTSEVRKYLLQRAAINPGSSIIEVGCGTGVVLSNLPGSLTRYGLDINSQFLAHAAALSPDARLTSGDAHRLPYAAGCFDAVCCHFLLLWVANPEQVLLEMVRICRPGGAVLVLAEPDYGGRIDHPEGLSGLGTAQTESLRDQGADPLLGRKLAGLMAAAGFACIEIGIIGSRWQPTMPSSESMENEWEVLHHDLDDRLSPTELTHSQALDQAAWSDGSRVLYVPTFYAYGETARP
jgi:SAM-dependent methyltransferase